MEKVPLFLPFLLHPILSATTPFPRPYLSRDLIAWLCCCSMIATDMLADMLADTCSTTTSPCVAQVFNTMDRDGNGELDVDEFEGAMDKLGEPSHVNTCNKPAHMY